MALEEVRVLASSLSFPEGPVWFADGSLIVVETSAGRLTRVGSNGSIEVVAETGGGPNGLALGPDGALYVANNGGLNWVVDAAGNNVPTGWREEEPGRIERVNVATGEVSVLYERCGSKRLNAPNDIVFDSHGGFYFTDMGKTRSSGHDIGVLYYGRPDGSEIHEVALPMLAPNGVGISPDGTVLYAAETDTARLWAWDIESPGMVAKQPGAPHGGRLIAGLGGYQRFDSLAVDAAGNICVGTLVTGAITIISPDGSNIVQKFFPDTNPTNICFGGADLKTAFITLSRTGRLVALEWEVRGLPLAFSA